MLLILGGGRVGTRSDSRSNDLNDTCSSVWATAYMRKSGCLDDRLSEPVSNLLECSSPASVAQGIEHRSPKAGVDGSNPPGGTSKQDGVAAAAPFLVCAVRGGFEPAGVARLSKRVSVCQRACEGARAPEAADGAAGRESARGHQGTRRRRCCGAVSGLRDSASDWAWVIWGRGRFGSFQPIRPLPTPRNP